MYRLPIYILNEDKHPVSNTRDRSHTQLAKMRFDKIFDLTAGSAFLFLSLLINTLRKNQPTNCAPRTRCILLYVLLHTCSDVRTAALLFCCAVRTAALLFCCM